MLMTIDIPDKMYSRIQAWAKDFKQPEQNLVLGLVDEYFEDSDTGQAILEEYNLHGQPEWTSWEQIKQENGLVS